MMYGVMQENWSEIKKNAKAGQMGAVNIMAKDLVRSKRFVQKMIEMRSHLWGVQQRMHEMKSFFPAHQSYFPKSGNCRKNIIKHTSFCIPVKQILPWQTKKTDF